MGDFFVIMKKYKTIKKSAEFQQIIQKKRYRNSSSYSVYFQSKQEECGRIGISVPKKLGNAVIRNKTKRQVRMILQELKADALEFDAIIMVRKQYFDKSYEENCKDLENLLKTVKI